MDAAETHSAAISNVLVDAMDAEHGLKPVNKSYSGAFVYGCPLVKVLSVPSRCAFQAVIRHFFNVYLHFFSRNKNLGIPAVTLAYVWLLLLASAQSESFGSIDPETGVCANFVDY